ncbi:hypothetical protein ERO13_A05G046000v2 [Gossypium hirsutum]|nr:hypothetical protein ERO13_A05G046000v2 [Gossypium hirsutum]
MAKTGAQASPVVVFSMFMLFIVLFFSFVVSDNGKEVEILLSFKSSIYDPSGFLSNWDSSATFCQWHGVTCYNNLSHVDKLDLSAKNLTGKLVSSSIFHLPFIQTLNISNNQFYGEIPEDMFSSSSSSLRFLNLSNNNFTGQIPSGSIPGLEVLDLSNNMLSGKIPPEIGSFYSLKFLDLGGNVLVGEIPVSITNITSLQFLTLASNQLVGPIPHGLSKMKSLEWIYVGYNNLSGQIPEEIGMLTSLNHLDLVYNNLTSEIPSSLGNLSDLQYLFLYQNKLTVLQLWSNRLSGEIPESLGKNNNLTILDLSTNNLTGRIPDGLCSSGRLFKLILFSNSLESAIPKNLSTCTSLQRVRLQKNRLSGELSSEFTKLPLVYFLDVSNNDLSGNIGDQEWDIPALEMLSLAGNRFSGRLPNSFGSQKIEDLDLSGNGFSGTIPRSFGSLTELMQFSLSGNKLIGEIPKELSSCKKLVSLDLSHNQLSGQIPSGFAEMPVLSQLDLSDNQLSGEVPPQLGKMESLIQVNVSHNHLHGSLPSTGAFLAINSSAVSGNDLCGGAETSALPPCKKVKNLNWWFYVACSLVALVLLAFAAFGFIFIRKRNNLELKRVENEDGIWELQFFDSNVSKSVTVDDITLSAKQVNGICRGNKSSANDFQFVVKEMNDVNSIPSSFWSEIKQLGKLQHPNLVNLIGTCRSDKNAYLVYEYIKGKLLSEILHELTWERRRQIAMGIAKALKFLHSYCSPSIIVGDMSPERVIVDGKDEPRLRLRLPGLLSTENKAFISSEYVAPETRESKDMSEKSDIYGFGLILIELLTGKSPADAEFGDQHQSMVEWARYCYSDCHLDMWVDPMIRPGHASDVNHNQIVETLSLALHCTAGDPTARPSATDVSKTLQSAFRITSCVSTLKLSSSV